MIIENPEAFKAWLTTVLEPLCDADPEALAKYVYALIKKDKPTEELRKSMLTQLEVFLQKETQDFVEFLFSKLEAGLTNDNTYMIKIKEEPMESASLKTGTGTVTADEDELLALENCLLEDDTADDAKEAEKISETLDQGQDMESELNTTTETVLSDVNPDDPTPPVKEQVLQQSSSQGDSPRLRNGSFGSAAALSSQEERHLTSRSRERKSDSEREEKVGYYIRRRGSSGSPPTRRSRSRSWERRSSTRRSRSKSRRSRSRARERDRSRAWRNKSPPPRSRYERDRDRKMRSWSKSPPPRSRSRSPPSKMRSRYRNRSPVIRSHSRSHSPYDSSRKSTPGGVTPTQDSNHGDEGRLMTSMHSVVNVKDPSSKIRRCRDYDEKGYCMRGELCPFDHGTDPVVLEDVGVLSFSGSSVKGLPPPDVPTPAHAQHALLQPALAPGMALHRPPLNRPPPNLSEYNPDAPSMEPRMWSKQPFRTAGRGMIRGMGGIRGPPSFVPHQRELISVPVMEGEEGPYYPMGGGIKRPCPPDFSNDMDAMSPLKQRFDYARLGNRRGNCSLQLKKVPQGLNNIAHLHNHFVKFGKIVNIQVCFEGDPEAALITFTSHAEASAAYKSTEAVLNNRFIKVFWYNPDKDNKQENVAPLNRTSAKERLGAPVVNPTMNSSPASSNQEPKSEVEKVFISGTNITKTVYIPTAMEKKLVKADPKKMIITTNYPSTQEMQIARESLKKKQEEKRKEALKLTQHLCKRKHDLIEKLLCHQKELIEKLEKGNITPEQKVEIMQTIQGFQENIDIIRKDIKSTIAKPTSTVKVSTQLLKRTREEQQEGKDTSELHKRVLELKTKAHNLNLLANNGVIRLARPRYRSTRGRGGFNPHSTVDHRPTKLLVSGFESDDKVEVLEHFSKFGEVVDHVYDEATPALVIQFKTRKDAETAMAKGRNFQDRLMSVTWFSSAQNMGMRGPGMRSVILLNDNVADLLSEHDDEEEALRINLDQNEDFLLQDEEDEEDEERSWRR